VADAVEFSGRTVEDAVSRAEAALSALRDDLDIEIIAQGSRGVFGIGAEDARIRARPKGTEATPSATRTEEPAFISEESGSELGEAEGSVAVAARPSTPVDGELLDEASDVLQKLLTSMGFDVEVTVQRESDPVMLSVSGDNLGVLIGRRGDNLSALQFMVNLILSKNRRQWPRVVIDVENYRARREESLRSLADRIAYRVERNRRPFTLEAMPASDRRIIHLSLRDHPEIETYSIGEGVSRRVVIAPKQAAPMGGYREQA